MENQSTDLFDPLSGRKVGTVDLDIKLVSYGEAGNILLHHVNGEKEGLVREAMGNDHVREGERTNADKRSGRIDKQSASSKKTKDVENVKMPKEPRKAESVASVSIGEKEEEEVNYDDSFEDSSVDEEKSEKSDN